MNISLFERNIKFKSMYLERVWELMEITFFFFKKKKKKRVLMKVNKPL